MDTHRGCSLVEMEETAQCVIVGLTVEACHVITALGLCEASQTVEQHCDTVQHTGPTAVGSKILPLSVDVGPAYV